MLRECRSRRFDTCSSTDLGWDIRSNGRGRTRGWRDRRNRLLDIEISDRSKQSVKEDLSLLGHNACPLTAIARVNDYSLRTRASTLWSSHRSRLNFSSGLSLRDRLAIKPDTVRSTPVRSNRQLALLRRWLCLGLACSPVQQILEKSRCCCVNQ